MATPHGGWALGGAASTMGAFAQPMVDAALHTAVDP
jgi:hypothetical protein